MWCLVSQPNGVVLEVEVDHKAKGQQCLEKVSSSLRLFCPVRGARGTRAFSPALEPRVPLCHFICQRSHLEPAEPKLVLDSVVCNTCVLSARIMRGTRLFCSRRRPQALQDTLEKISVVLLLGAAIRFAVGKVCDLHDWTYVTAIPNRGAFNKFCSSILHGTLSFSVVYNTH
jgi:hypothetical protein